MKSEIILSVSFWREAVIISRFFSRIDALCGYFIGHCFYGSGSTVGCGYDFGLYSA